MKPLIIYHAHCADGFGAAWAAYRRFGADGAEYLPMEYKDPRVSLSGFGGELTFPTEVAGRDIYIFDFSFPRAVMEHLILTSSALYWRDHHKTAFEAIERDPGEVYRHVDHGAGVDVLLHGGLSVPFFLRLIEDRDLGRLWKPGGAAYPATRDFNTGLRSEPYTFENFDCAEQCWVEIADTGRSMNRLYDRQVADLVANRHTTKLGDWAGFAVNCPGQFASDVGNALALLAGGIGVTWFVDKDGTVCVSLRSIGDVDVSAIAVQMGGGGHLNAAGFKTQTVQISGDRVTFGAPDACA
ncbi:MAG: DHHA1 domain-containing protein [Zoogloea sp.]|uniref:DHHA1 domain-containing protein n=1 Tax=Zoogloea sp. TaxID=49181 RepID=UPI00260F525E|nr:DHHA1 domain-containing protein [Zoogloea sp.]MDD2989830.1 DHHA1 domain-containing protein [Zoogloea sp.]